MFVFIMKGLPRRQSRVQFKICRYKKSIIIRIIFLTISGSSCIALQGCSITYYGAHATGTVSVLLKNNNTLQHIGLVTIKIVKPPLHNSSKNLYSKFAYAIISSFMNIVSFMQTYQICQYNAPTTLPLLLLFPTVFLPVRFINSNFCCHTFCLNLQTIILRPPSQKLVLVRLLCNM